MANGNGNGIGWRVAGVLAALVTALAAGAAGHYMASTGIEEVERTLSEHLQDYRAMQSGQDEVLRRLDRIETNLDRLLERGQ